MYVFEIASKLILAQSLDVCVEQHHIYLREDGVTAESSKESSPYARSKLLFTKPLFAGPAIKLLHKHTDHPVLMSTIRALRCTMVGHFAMSHQLR